MMKGDLPPDISSIDTDILVVGTAEASEADSGIAGVHTYTARIDLRAIQIDNAQVLGAVHQEATNAQVQKALAARTALEQAGDQIAPALLSTLAVHAGPREIELVVHGIPDRAAGAALKKALEARADIKTVVVRRSAQTITKIDLESTLDAEALADALDQAPGLPLDIVQSSRASLLARYDATRGIRLRVRALAPTGDILPADRWVLEIVPRAIASSATSLSFLDYSTDVLPGSAASIREAKSADP